MSEDLTMSIFRESNSLQNIIKQNEYLWDIYTRKEEYYPKHLDNYGRFAYIYSENREIFEPIVSKYLTNKGLNIEYPEDKVFAVCLTHDVDEIYPPLMHTILSAMICLKFFDLKELKHNIIWRFIEKEKSPYWNFQEIMDIEEKYEARSSFYFLSSDTDIKRFRYLIEDLEFELSKIADRGWEVGLHGGYYAYNDLDAILHEKMRLEQVLGTKIKGYRNHYLRFNVPNSWEILEKAGFEYDTTLGYNDQVGFRNGMCHPFKPYNLYANEEVDIVEIPLHIMDGTLFGSCSSFSQAWDMAKMLIDTVESCHGVLTLNWHSNSFNCPFKRSWPKLYIKMLEYCHQKNSWMTSGEKIRNFFCSSKNLL